MNTKNIQTLLDKQPNASENTYLVFILLGISWVLMIVLFILAIGLWIENLSHYSIFLDWLVQKTALKITPTEEQRSSFSLCFGLLCFGLSLVFLGGIFLCRMILHRNQFILEIEDWLFANIASIQKKTPKK